MNSQDEYIKKILSLKEEDMITDLVTNDSNHSTYRKVSRRFIVIREIKDFYRLILVEVGNELELITQSWGGGFVKEGWCDNRSIALTVDEINEIKEIVDKWK